MAEQQRPAAIGSMTVAALLDGLGGKTPVPGGGAVASIVGALAGALGRMVVAYSVGRRSLAEHAELHERAQPELERFASLLIGLADEDAAAYAELNAAFGLAKDDPARAKAIADGAALAIQPPRAVLAACVALARLLAELCGKSNAMLASDLAIAGLLAEAGGRSAWHNVAVNLPLIGDDATRDALAAESDSLLRELEGLAGSIAEACTPAR